MAFKTKYPNCRHNFGRTRPVARFQGLGGKYIFRGNGFCFHHMFKTNLGKNKKDLGVTAPECPPVSAGLGRTVARKSSIGGLHVCAGRPDILKIYF